jgi:hypothetical protein
MLKMSMMSFIGTRSERRLKVLMNDKSSMLSKGLFHTVRSLIGLCRRSSSHVRDLLSGVTLLLAILVNSWSRLFNILHLLELIFDNWIDSHKLTCPDYSTFWSPGQLCAIRDPRLWAECEHLSDECHNFGHSLNLRHFTQDPLWVDLTSFQHSGQLEVPSFSQNHPLLDFNHSEWYSVHTWSEQTSPATRESSWRRACTTQTASEDSLESTILPSSSRGRSARAAGAYIQSTMGGITSAPSRSARLSQYRVRQQRGCMCSQ